MKALKITPIVTLLKPYSFMISVAVLARLTRSRYVMRYIKQRRISTTQRTELRPDDSSFSISIPPSPCGKSGLTRMLVAVAQIYTAKSLAAMFFRLRLGFGLGENRPWAKVPSSSRTSRDEDASTEPIAQTQLVS